MARAAVQRRLTWRLGRLTRRIDETARAKTLVLEVPDWPGHLAGQHVDVRLTAPDGYQAERSYSIASAPEGGEQVALTVERIEDGEVSPYLVDELAAGDQLELRGPIGGYFVWSAGVGGPLLLVAGGSGIRRSPPRKAPIVSDVAIGPATLWNRTRNSRAPARWRARTMAALVGRCHALPPLAAPSRQPATTLASAWRTDSLAHSPMATTNVTTSWVGKRRRRCSRVPVASITASTVSSR